MTPSQIIEAEVAEAEVPMSDALARALETVEDLERDAKRCQWLIENGNARAPGGSKAKANVSEGAAAFVFRYWIPKSEVRAVIDAAMENEND